MCVIHSTHHLACGHQERDINAMVHSRCDAVSAALWFYHDQPNWQPLGEPLTLPKTCEAVYPPQDGVLGFDVLADQAYWDQWIKDQFEINGFGAYRRQKMMMTTLGPRPKSTPNMSAPYPANQFRQYNALIKYRDRANKAPNVDFKVAPGACRRCTQAAIDAAAEQSRSTQGGSRHE